MYQQEGKYAVAENYAAEVLATRRHAVGSDSPITIDAAAALASVYLSQLRFAESQPLAREALNFCQAKQPDEWQRFRAEILLGISLAGQNKDAEAEFLLLEGYQGMVARRDRIPAPTRYLTHLADEWIVRLRSEGLTQKGSRN